MKYPRVIDEEGIELERHPRTKGAFELLKFMCCDCGLVHKMSFAIEKNGNLGIAMKRLAGSTAAARRHKKGLRLPR
jgi:hypothetical protein